MLLYFFAGFLQGCWVTGKMCCFLGCSICFSTCNVCALQSHSFTKYEANFWVLANATGEKLYILPSYLTAPSCHLVTPAGLSVETLVCLFQAVYEWNHTVCTLFLNHFEIHLLCCAYNSFFLTAGETPIVGQNSIVPHSADVFSLAANC